MRALVVEDLPDFRDMLRIHLTCEGFSVDEASSGEEALWMLRVYPYDVILLDLWLPDTTGIEVCRTLRSERRWTPVLMLTAAGDVDSCVQALEAGADEFVIKPVSLLELTARVRVLLRRGPSPRPAVLRCAGLTLDPAKHQVCRDGVPITLRPLEFSLLELLMYRQGDVLSRGVIIEHVWDFAFDADSNVVDVHVAALRRKIDRPFGTDSIETVRGVGYRLRADESKYVGG